MRNRYVGNATHPCPQRSCKDSEPPDNIDFCRSFVPPRSPAAAERYDSFSKPSGPPAKTDQLAEQELHTKPSQNPLSINLPLNREISNSIPPPPSIENLLTDSRRTFLFVWFPYPPSPLRSEPLAPPPAASCIRFPTNVNGCFPVSSAQPPAACPPRIPELIFPAIGASQTLQPTSSSVIQSEAFFSCPGPPPRGRSKSSHSLGATSTTFRFFPPLPEAGFFFLSLFFSLSLV